MLRPGVRHKVTRHKVTRLKARKAPTGEEGAVLVFVALSLVVIAGIVGLAMDVGQMYVSKQKAQSAADAAVQAGAMDMFNRTNDGKHAGTSAFGSGTLACASPQGQSTTPCYYAAKNGFSGPGVVVDFPACGK